MVVPIWKMVRCGLLEDHNMHLHRRERYFEGQKWANVGHLLVQATKFCTVAPSTVSVCYSLFLSVHIKICLTFRKSVHHRTIQINQPTRCSSFTCLLLDVYVHFNMFRASSRPSSGAYDCTGSLWFYRCSVAVGVLLVVVCQTTTNNTPTATLQR